MRDLINGTVIVTVDYVVFYLFVFKTRNNSALQ